MKRVHVQMSFEVRLLGNLNLNFKQSCFKLKIYFVFTFYICHCDMTAEIHLYSILAICTLFILSLSSWVLLLNLDLNFNQF